MKVIYEKREGGWLNPSPSPSPLSLGMGRGKRHKLPSITSDFHDTLERRSSSEYFQNYTRDFLYLPIQEGKNVSDFCNLQGKS